MSLIEKRPGGLGRGGDGAAAALPVDVTGGDDLRPFVGVHARTLLIGMLLVAGMAYVAPYADLVTKQIQLGTLQFAPGAVGAFLLVYAIIQPLRRTRAMRWVTSADLLTLYVMLFVGVFTVARGLLQRLIPTLAYVNYFSTASNNFTNLFSVHTRPELVVFDPYNGAKQAAAQHFFEGGHVPIPWEAWIVPLIGWTALFVLILWTFLCLAAILRRQWADSERLSFPHTILPFQLMEEGGASSLLSSPLTWIGVGIPVVIYTINGLHQSFPSIPEIPLFFPDLQKNLTTPPWDKIMTVSVYVSFAALGFAYLLPSDLLFSLWFFFLLTRLGDVVCRAAGIDPTGMPSFPCRAYIGYQAAGAYVTLALLFAYGGRHYFKSALQETFRFGRKRVANESEDEDDDSDELLPRRVAVWGLLAGFVGIVAWSAWAGLSLWLAVSVWGIYIFVTATVLARSVSEAGLLMTETSFRPSDIVGMFSAKATWGPTNWAVLSMLNGVFFRDMRGLFMALFLDDQKLAGDVRMRRRALITPLVLAIMVSLLVGTWAHLKLSYDFGALNLGNYGTSNAGWAYTDAASTLNGAPDALPTAPKWFAVGAVVTALLSLLRARFVMFPLHPLAYALAPTWTLWVMWFPILVIWIVKSLMLRYGGSNLYRRARPFFLGLILGEFGMAAIWAIISAVTKCNAPLFPTGG